MALYHFSVKALSRGTRSTVRAIAYRAGCDLQDVQTGEEKPHCHVLLITRSLGEDGFAAKVREWNSRELLSELREQWTAYSNFHLKLHGEEGEDSLRR